MIRDDYLWTERYRPKTIKDTILPSNLKAIFQAFVDQKNVPTLLLTGASGIGKTTCAMAMLDELEADYIMVNGSLEGRLIDTLRTMIIDYASTVSFQGGRKYVIIDEADYLNPQTVQPALRNFIEEFASNCGFILTCNYKSKLIPAIHSRCSTVGFRIAKEDAPDIAHQFYKRACDILAKENIKYEAKAVAGVVKKYYPDFRRVLNELQKYSVVSQINTGILVDLKEISLKEVCGFLKKKDFKSLRKWASDNSDLDPSSLFQSFFDYNHQFFKKTSIPHLILLLSRYQYQSAFVVNQEINTMAFFVEIMGETEFLDG